MPRTRYPLRPAFFNEFARTHAGALALLRLGRIRHADEIRVEGGSILLAFAGIEPASSRDFEDCGGLAAIRVSCHPATVPLYVGVEMPAAVDEALRALVAAKVAV